MEAKKCAAAEIGGKTKVFTSFDKLSNASKCNGIARPSQVIMRGVLEYDKLEANKNK